MNVLAPLEHWKRAEKRPRIGCGTISSMYGRSFALAATHTRELRLLRDQVEDPDLLPRILDVQPDLLPLDLIRALVLDLRVGLDPARAERLLRPPREVSPALLAGAGQEAGAEPEGEPISEVVGHSRTRRAAH